MTRVEDRMGVTYRQLSHWSERGYLRPLTNEGKRQWPDIEIRIGRMMSRLIAIGITPAKAAYYAREAVVNHTPMLLEFQNGKLTVRGPFSRAIRRSLARQQSVVQSRRYVTSEEAG